MLVSQDPSWNMLQTEPSGSNYLWGNVQESLVGGAVAWSSGGPVVNNLLRRRATFDELTGAYHASGVNRYNNSKDIDGSTVARGNVAIWKGTLVASNLPRC